MIIMAGAVIGSTIQYIAETEGVHMSGAVIGSTIINTLDGEDDMGGVVAGSTIKYIAESEEEAMGGLVAGSTMRNVVGSRKKWGALMINTGCNLDCPRCYLGKKEGNVTMSQEMAEKLADYAVKNWEGVVIIGTEPLLDERSVEIINIFAPRIGTHLITNGVNLPRFADRIKNVKRIDVSLDGGPKTYRRGGDFQQILAGARRWKESSGGELYVLHVLSQENCENENVTDMLFAGLLFGAEKTIFSPYIQTIGGRSEIATIPIKEIAERLRDFSWNKDWTLIIDPYHALLEGRGWDEIREDVSDLSEENRLIIDFDPGERIDRVDVEGNFHHPFLALHPGIKLSGAKLF